MHNSYTPVKVSDLIYSKASSKELTILKIDEMITLFEEGMLLTKICNKKLKEAEKKIEKLLNQSDSLDK